MFRIPFCFAAAVIAAACSMSFSAVAQTAYNIGTEIGGGVQVTGPARLVKLESTGGVVIEADGSLLIVDYNRVLRRDTATNLVSVIAGNPDTAVAGGFSGDGGPATDALLHGPRGIAVDSSGNIYVADQSNYRVRRIERATGIISTVAGTGVSGYTGEGGPAVDAQLGFPRAVAMDSSGGLLIADAIFGNSRIRRVDLTSGLITTIAGGGMSSADDVPATTAALCGVSDVLAAPDGYIYIANQSCGQIRRIAPGTNLISTYVNASGLLGASNDGNLAAATTLAVTSGMAIDVDGNLLVVETDRHRVLRVDKATTVVTTIAGAGSVFLADPDGVPAVDVALFRPSGIVAGASGNIYFGGNTMGRVFFLAPTPFGLTGRWSAKFHPAPASLPFLIPLAPGVPIGGPVTIEPRAIGSGHILSLRFNGFVSSLAGVSVIDKNAAPVGTISSTRNRNDVQIILTNVPDKTRVTVTLAGVNGVDYSVSLGFLAGDVNGDGIVDDADASAAKARAGQRAVDAAAQYDVSVSGMVTAADIAAIKARMGNVLP